MPCRPPYGKHMKSGIDVSANAGLKGLRSRFGVPGWKELPEPPASTTRDLPAGFSHFVRIQPLFEHPL